MDNEKIKALIEVASKAENQDALDGVLELQEVIKTKSELEVQLEALQSKYDKDTAERDSRIQRLTGDLAHFIAKVGTPSQEESNSGKSRDELYREYSLRGY